MRKLFLFLTPALLFVAILAMAVFQGNMARERAFSADRVVYARHLPPPDALDQLYQKLGYRLPDVRKGTHAVPRIFFASLPDGLQDIPRATDRKRAFIATMLPLILRVNELVLEDRKRLLSLMEQRTKGARLSTLNKRWLHRLARNYGLGADFKIRDDSLKRLEKRVDIVPPSLALAQAAIESGWGTSRFAQTGNALYGQWTWNDEDNGIVPTRRGSGKTHRIKAFDFLIDSVRGYIGNINRNRAYTHLRTIRQKLRANNQPVTGRPLTPGLIQYSERREAYVQDLQSIISGNRLEDFDAARLAVRSTTWGKRPSPLHKRSSKP
ncbi:hypothetical protein JCM17844_19650 [Iodidimonas gelatinilytica]|uniref:Mannosyl-glycoprotein endo-beta-N-acetylglucosamidase-like domain-containing protein n=1 Tax=Iodidimonas gelatinilytica TaxID=1236966 RepID=A0A5A7N1E9_9PROT|nr:glucosaminidase domain-containing protein [Iodidimonas gelatinilytica]GEQ98328.1 hypothetical protein JCM17844_19650 [Iodidimonas gelatinilytica]GER02093.1 hypothetical protein JCM17845_27160 [Iodidimonas gelatinilytica]